ncbi:energy-coupling factor transporter transmembrane protein [Ligilactobacillus salitolerans]|uniref:Energy-coupling factor transporter transmembrane protein n=1 Tax=Ligilactobacillus salitolerans TaxID=1808352 RepID=A0A401IRN9_9LACO|nr:energy-coupling factor transporter transmembrane component T [Ligilactobacillus salitolerans]GBG94199.1 energy-coupling factor transporter transmembrane protein [Ligilactobacillus salitolerans]
MHAELEKQGPWISRLSGTTKIVLLLALSAIGMVSYDTRYLVVLTIFALIFFYSARLKWRQIKALVYAIVGFTLLNLVLVYIFSPQYGTQIYGSSHILFGSGFLAVTAEELFYLLNMTLKYIFIVPLILAFLYTTDPSELAAGMNKIKIPYKVCYAVELSLRYIPDFLREYRQISFAQQARGLEISKKANLWQRVKGSSQILIPLVFSSLDRIEVTTRAMRLRRFGTQKKRSWYKAHPLSKLDWFLLGVTALLVVCGIWLFQVDQGRYYDPF